MGTLNNRQLLAALALGLSFAACGDDGEKGPSGGPSINLDGGVPALIDSGLGKDATSVVPGTDGAAVVDSGVVVPPVNTGDCKGANGCYSCKPTPTITSPQLLNTCSTGCREFDNAKRIPGFTGTLPPLQ
jgi:hypothetical protein